MIKFNSETFEESIDDITKLSADHYNEVSIFVGVLECKPDYGIYKSLCEAGVLSIITARDSNTNELVGYCIDSISKSLHYSNDNFAINDVVYLAPKHRKSTVGYRLLKHVRDVMKAKGVSAHLLHMKDSQKFDRVAEKLGYNLLDLVYCNVLKGDD